MSGASIHDSRKHPICPPYYGESGPAYTRVFRTDFVANLWSEVDDGGHSLAEHILGLDEGSPGNPIVGAAAYQAKARRLRNTRSKKVFTHLRKHIEHASFRAAMNDQAVVGNGLAALALADQWFSGEASNLKLEKQNAEWQNVKLAQFGIHANSIRMLEQHLQTLNGERPAGHIYNNNQLGARLLACLTFPDTLQSDAMKEMHSPTLTSPVNTPGNDASGTPLAGQYDIMRIVTVYEAFFRAQIEAGRVKITDAPKQSKPHSSNRVDGLSLEINRMPDIEMILYECEEVDDHGYEVYEVEFTDGHGTNEKLCWNCGGLGHTQRDNSKPPGQDWVCPSPKKRRDPKAHIAALTKLAAARGGGNRPRVKFGQRPPGGQGPKNRFAKRPGAKANEAELGGEDSGDEGLPALIHDSENELSSVESNPSKGDTPNQPAISALKVIDELGELGDFDHDFKKAFGISDISGISLDLAEVDPETFNDASSEMNYSFLAMMTTAFFFLAKSAMLAVGNLARGPGQVARSSVLMSFSRSPPSL